jgi:hypothetical protein
MYSPTRERGAVLQSEEQLADFGPVCLELRMAEFVIAYIGTAMECRSRTYPSLHEP